MEWGEVLWLLYSALFGAILGSFLNALLFRFNTGKGMGGRSKCMHCSHVLGALDLVPIFSYLLLRGKCRYCGAKISVQYPVVEGAMALLTTLTYLSHPTEPLMFVFWTLVWALLLFITVYDIRHTIIPWSFSIALLALSLFSLVTHFSLVWLLAGPLLALPLFLFSLVSNGRWMGWGDSLLMLSLGWLLGPGVGLAALMLAFWSGAVVGLLLILLSRWKRITSRFTIKSEIPFAPFLALGAVLAYFLHVDFLIPFAFLW